MNIKNYSNTSGNVLLQVLIAFGLVGILASVMASVLTGQQKQMRLLEQKSESLNIKNQMLMTFLNSDVCACNLNPALVAGVSIPSDVKATFDATQTDGSEYLELHTLRYGCSSGDPLIISKDQPLTSGLQLSSIRLENLRPSGVTDEWIGNWQVSWQEDSKAGPLKQISFAQRFNVDSSSPDSEKRVVSCMANITGGPGGNSSVGKFKTTPAIATGAFRKPTSVKLGKFPACYLTSVRTVHETQACGCSVTADEQGEWSLNGIADSKVSGFCSCEAQCLENGNL